MMEKAIVTNASIIISPDVIAYAAISLSLWLYVVAVIASGIVSIARIT